MKQIAIVSGKGGTGKTSLVASLAALAKERVVTADCDVDAPDLHLILQPTVRERREFFGMKKASIDESKCTKCGSCLDHCRFGAVHDFQIDPALCESCGVCKLVCPSEAVAMIDRLSGYAYISDTRFGPLVHAQLFPGEEASGKLVAMVREMARTVAASHKRDLVLIDGSPGIGCPVIASLTGVDLALVVTEPTITGEHDLERILDVAGHFGIKTLVCVNKYDLNLVAAQQIEDLCRARGVEIAGKLPFDPSVVDAMVQAKPIVEVGGPAAEAILGLWKNLAKQL
ncbi:MAG: (4Fe-4S)-binding protein [Methanothrix sp.]|nr:MAG: (4Fe-4S)-binding protein [Methanothrix sp.]